MLIGEGSVFLLILVGGIIIIRRAFKREVELNQEQQNFLLSVTHELKTPIASVKLFIETLRKRDLAEDKKEVLSSQSIKELDRLDALVGKILMTRSIDNQNFFLDKKSQRLDSLIDRTIKNLKVGLLSKHNVEVDLEEIELSVDEDSIKSIIINLLENASKYSPQNSTISIKLKSDGNEVLLSVTDEGKGISDEFKQRAFSKFQRDENEMTRKSKGTGLGLYIVNYLVQQHGGITELKDNKPSGLIVEIRLKK